MAYTRFLFLVRSVSTSSIMRQMVKPPIQVFGLDGRYATALYSAASKQNNLDVVEKDLEKVQDTLKNDSRLREFLGNRTITRFQKVEAMKILSEKISLSPQTSNLLQLLAENARLNNIDAIIEVFKLLLSAHRGQVVCEVITAIEMTPEQRKQLDIVLKTFIKTNQKLHLSVKVDPSIVGGMIVSIGDRYVDMSIATKIKKYTDLISPSV